MNVIERSDHQELIAPLQIYNTTALPGFGNGKGAQKLGAQRSMRLNLGTFKEL